MSHETFVETTLIPDWAKFLISAGKAAPSADNSQPWHFYWEDGKLELRIDLTKHLLKLGRDHPAIGLSMGCAIENIIQAASAAGIPHNAVELFPENNSDIYLRIYESKINPPLNLDERLPLFERQTNRYPYGAEKIHEEIIDSLSVANDHVKVVVFQNQTEINKISRLIRVSSQARFQNEQVHKWFTASLRFNKQAIMSGDGLDIGTLALPPGGGLLLKIIAAWSRMKLLNAFGAYRLFSLLESLSFRKCGAIVALIGDGDTEQDIVSCGRVLESVWITLNGSGYAVHPYFVLSDQLYRLKKKILPTSFVPLISKLNDDSDALFDLGGKQLMMLLRVGKPKRHAKRSLRLTFDDITSWRNTNASEL